MTGAGRPPLVPDHRVALVLGFAGVGFAVLMFHDAYENRGKDRPWWLSLVPGG